MSDSSQRYSRQIILDGVGEDGQAKLKNSKVLMVGAGGLGCPAAQYLVAAGVGQLTIMDDDVVDLSNLGRQILFGDEDVGKPKVLVAQEKLQKLNPEVRVIPVRDRFNQTNAEFYVQSHDVILDGSDNFATKFLINDACVKLGKPFSHAGVLRWEGQLMTYLPGGPCYRCLFESPPPADDVPNCSSVGTLGPVAGVIANLQAAEVLKLILGEPGVLSGALLTLDARQMKTRRIGFSKNPQCQACGPDADLSELKEEGLVQCDLRQKREEKIWLLTFEGHHRVIKAERHLKSKGYEVEAKVTPRQLSHECGICLEVKAESLEQLTADLAEKKLKAERQGRPGDFLEDESKL
jgi:molybdopterin/thiamine biosynthesis adenylyltransferase